jgi:23S rRNA (cytidine1920-2'-O)/16S rRNA (cytidine1409-2'-O)-methyltransferase
VRRLGVCECGSLPLRFAPRPTHPQTHTHLHTHPRAIASRLTLAFARWVFYSPLMKGVRLDIHLAEAGLLESRELAQRVIRAGQVRVNEQLVDKPSALVREGDTCEVIEPPRFVSRGGDKLLAALEAFPVTPKDCRCIDIGSSTGGFTDCMLQHGAVHVVDVDVGKGQLHWKLRNDPRVTVMEGVNARYLTPADLPYAPQWASVDVSFISLTKVLPALIDVLDTQAEIITLIKPQFEAGRRQVQKGGVVRSDVVRQECIEAVRAFGTNNLRLRWNGVVESPVRGPAGNVEFLAHWTKSGESL